MAHFDTTFLALWLLLLQVSDGVLIKPALFNASMHMGIRGVVLTAETAHHGTTVYADQF